MQGSQHSYIFFTLMNSFLLLLTQIHPLGLAARAFYRMTLRFLHLLCKQRTPAPSPILRYNLSCDELMRDSPSKHVGSLRIHRNAPEEQLRNPGSIIGFLLQGLRYVPQEILIQSFAFCRDAAIPKKYLNRWWHQRPILFPRKELIILRLFFSVIHAFPIDLAHCPNLTNPPCTHSRF